MSGAAVTKEEELIEHQLEAYNAHDLEAFLGFYDEDVRFYDPPGELKYRGISEARKRYAQRFTESPGVRVTIKARIVQGSFVIDHELVTGLPGGEARAVVVIYEVRKRKICNVWFLR